MNTIHYQEGDIFAAINDTNKTVVLPHICNCIGAWGSGFVVPLGNTFPQSKEQYLTLCHNAQNTGERILGHTQLVTARNEPKVIVANMIAQVLGGQRPLRYQYLALCMEFVGRKVCKMMDVDSYLQIYAPLFGAGLAGGNWSFIEELIRDCWLLPGIPVTIFYMRDRLPPGWTPPICVPS